MNEQDSDTHAQYADEFRLWTESSGTGVTIDGPTEVPGSDDELAADGVDLSDRFNELQSRAIESIHDEAERAMEQAEGRV
jgi:hypothetical protein